MTFRSSFVQYPKPMTYLVMLFDFLMILILLFFVVLAIVLLAFPAGYLAIPLAIICLLFIPGLFIDLLSLSQSGFAIEDKAIIERFGRREEVEIRLIQLIDCRVLLQPCYYARINGTLIVEISKEDREMLVPYLEASDFRLAKTASVPFLRLSSFTPL